LQTPNTTIAMKSAVIVSYARTPIGKIRGSLAHLSAPQLGAAAIRGALSNLTTNNEDNVVSNSITEAYFGNVLSAGIGQAPCRQAVLGAGLHDSIICNTINKVCASGMKSIMLASQTIECNVHGGGSGSGKPFAMLAGGMESMSNTPHYLLSSRSGTALGNATLLDGIIHDGLWDPYDNVHMGTCAEKCATEYNISRDDQDRYAIESYTRAREAQKAGIFNDEIVPIEGPKKRDKPIEMISIDEEPNSVSLDKLPTLRTAFEKNGTVTAGNASSINDGAAALILMSEDNAIAMGLTPLARIRGYGDAEGPPVRFTTAPSNAVPIAVNRAGMSLDDIEYHEINEAFSVVALANMMILNLDESRVNVFGGAVALGHPIGMSGARIVGTLYHVLKKKDATIGCASICNGGGGASAIVIERLS
jgi:acetyl-CoA C-acetyltransferase